MWGGIVGLQRIGYFCYTMTYGMVQRSNSDAEGVVIPKMEKEIIQLLEERGPLTGSEIQEATEGDVFLLWRFCMRSEALAVRTVGQRYLRLDRRIRGFARLSPSILREFLTYSVVGLATDQTSLTERAHEIRSHIEQVTRTKSELAHGIFSAIATRLEDTSLMRRRACVIIAGDVLYNMAHDIPRPERSTGRLVKGSDMDIVVVVDDLFPRPLIQELDQMIYHEKQALLMSPHLREEIDYVVKDMARVREQLRFKTFRHKVACKILAEGASLYGSEALFSTIKGMLGAAGITERLMDLESRAQQFRLKAQRHLLQADARRMKEAYQYLFYPIEESEEFE